MRLKKPSGKRIDNDKYFNEMLSLRQSGYITLENNHYILRGDWLRVVEEYEAAQISEQRENEAIKISKSANKKSTVANIISIVGVAVSSILSIVAIILSTR